MGWKSLCIHCVDQDLTALPFLLKTCLCGKTFISPSVNRNAIFVIDNHYQWFLRARPQNPLRRRWGCYGSKLLMLKSKVSGNTPFELPQMWDMYMFCKPSSDFLYCRILRFNRTWWIVPYVFCVLFHFCSLSYQRTMKIYENPSFGKRICISWKRNLW